MSKSKWVCSACGMWSGRKYSIKRHIANLHNGTFPIISYIDYIRSKVGPLSSKFTTDLSSTKTMAGTSSTNNFLDELVRTAARELVKKAFKPPPMRHHR